MSRSGLLRDVSIASLVLAFVPAVAHAQQTLPRIEVGAARRAAPRASSPAPALAAAPAAAQNISAAPGFQPSRVRLSIYRDPPGQTVTTVDHKFLRPTPMFTVREMLQYSPGVQIQDGNTAREVNISIRGSGSRFGVGYPLGVRNIMLYEDGFPITTADGTGRTDILDPHAYAGADVYRGPSSALFGNYATGGAVNFRTFSGAEVDGVDTGSEFGSFSYINNYLRAGKKVATTEFGEFDVSIFASDARGDGYLARSAFSGDQARLLARWSPTPSDRFMLKYLFNDSFSTFMNRSSQNQYYWNPYGKQFGCAIAVPANLPFCNNLNVPANGIFTSALAPLVNQSVWQLGSHLHSQQMIGGFRWEHDFDNATTWRSQVTYNYFDYINGTWPPPKVGPAVLGGLGGPVAIRGPSVGIDASTDVTSRAAIFGFPATHYLGFFYNNVKTTNPLFNQLPNVWNYGAIGGAVGKIDSYTSNIGLRAREEIALTPQLTGVVGFSSNWNRVWGVNTVYNYNANGSWRLPQQVGVDNDYWNTSPEASLTYRYSPEWQVRARYAAGYGTPSFLFLTSTQTGAGSNSNLQAQTNMGVDLGVDWTPSRNVIVSLTGFNEWFRNEILSLSNGLVSYQANVPASIHRGLEANIDWRPFDGWRFIAAYTLNDQFFTNYWDNLGALNGRFVTYNRSGNKIPNVSPHTLTARVGYDQPTGDFAGLGAYAEYVFKAGYTIDNANFTSLPGYGLVNLNVHYNRDISDFYFKNIEMYLNLNNVFDRTYIAGSFVMANTLVTGTAIQTPTVLLSTAQGAGILAGQPRSLVGGVKLRF
ncbi:TonB-dependent receptor family protein [Methylocystis parvus]|uniref:TonB-dependent receptor n=1 Tax=Methylocystis parvus TaxID=134 RepID=A0A6B8M532_9HYPH|nr:TonB-dependent receptor [Methylocystis parvus]QGM97508.1 TonB-dependent receptor [Methylocystis parvus]WBJ98568.1 TonB-dependent receptor [Methylocystis parvus OBBP]